VYKEVYKAKKEPCPKWIEVAKTKDLMVVDALEAIVDKGEAEFVTQYNEFINHEPKPFKPMIDKVMKL